MELFLLFAIAITVVAFIPIVLAKPIPSLNPNALIEIEFNTIPSDTIPTDHNVDLIPIAISNINWEDIEAKQAPVLLTLDDIWVQNEKVLFS